MNRHKGFTLIELMLSMALTVVIGVVAYRFLDAAILTSEQGSVTLERINKIDRFWALLQSDLEHLIDRSVPIPATGVDSLAGFPADTRRPALLSSFSYDFSLSDRTARDGALLWFVRGGWSNPLGQPRSELQRVLYRIDEQGNLRREYAPERNQDLSAPPVGSVVMLTDIGRVQFRFLPHDKPLSDSNWLNEWEYSGLQSETENEQGLPLLPRTLPDAIEVSVHSDTMGLLRQTLILPGQ